MVRRSRLPRNISRVSKRAVLEELEKTDKEVDLLIERGKELQDFAEV